MLHTFLAEQEERQVRLKQQRENKKVHDRPKTKTKDASTQFAPVQRQSADAVVQTDLSGDVVQELKEQVLNLTKIVSELITYKAQTQTVQVSESAQKTPRGSLLTELLSDSMSDLQDLCPDSYENSSTATPETPLPGLTPYYNSSPFGHPPRAPLRAIQENGVVNTYHAPQNSSGKTSTQSSSGGHRCLPQHWRVLMCFSLKLSWQTGTQVVRLAMRNWMSVKYVTCHRRFAKSSTRRLFNHSGSPCVQKLIPNAGAKEELLLTDSRQKQFNTLCHCWHCQVILTF